MKQNLIKAFHIKGFKPFSTDGRVIPIAPITVIFGQNSGGKSSILQALLVAHELITTGSLKYAFKEYSNNGIDIGGSKYAGIFAQDGSGDTKGKTKRSEYLAFAFWFESDRLDPFLRPPGIKNEDWDAILETWESNSEQYEDTPWYGPLGYWLEFVADPPETWLHGDLKSPYLGAIRLYHPCGNIAFDCSDWGIFKTDSFSWEYPSSLSSHDEKIYFPGLKLDFKFEYPYKIDLTCEDTPDEADQKINPCLTAWLQLLIGKCCFAIRDWMTDRIHIGPARATLKYTDEDKPIGPPGTSDHVLEALVKNDAGKLIENINDWLGKQHFNTNHQIDQVRLINIQFLSKSIDFGYTPDDWIDEFISVKQQFIEHLNNYKYKNLALDTNRAMKLLDMLGHGFIGNAPNTNADKIIPTILEQTRELLQKSEFLDEFDLPRGIKLLDVDRNLEVNFGDIGQGLVHLIPILVHALANRSKLHLIEQPELHLHPAMQSEFSDLFIQSVNDAENSYIIETHSEHILLRLLKRVRETAKHPTRKSYPVNLSQIKIIYVSKPDSALPQLGHWGSNERRYGHLDPGFSSVTGPHFAAFKSPSIEIIKISPAGKLIDWPRGFFPDRMKEIYSDEELASWFGPPPNTPLE